MLNYSVLGRLRQLFQSKDKHTPVIMPRREHRLSRQQVSQSALKVLYRLKEAGFAAYLVGGSVRDVLLQRTPKDYDVATDATPEQVREVFRNSRLIGRRFRIVHVYFHGEIIEVSTFRANIEESPKETDEDEKPAFARSDNIYGTIEEDAWRRDFTVNALYYNIADFSIVDYTGGMLDLKRRLIKMIGDPVQRYHEDPVRLLRAIRLAAKLEFQIHSHTEAPLTPLSNLLGHVAPARLFDEMLKLFFEGYALPVYNRLVQYQYVGVLFPGMQVALKARKLKSDKQLIELAMQETDERFADGKSLNPGFLLSVILWPALQHELDKAEKESVHFYQALHHAIDAVHDSENQMVLIPKRFKAMMRSIWVLQYHLAARRGNRVYRLVHHRYFRAAFDFLALRAKVGDVDQGLVDWWDTFRHADEPVKTEMVDELKQSNRKKRK